MSKIDPMLKQTIGYGLELAPVDEHLRSVSGTIAGLAPTAPSAIERIQIDDTLDEIVLRAAGASEAARPAPENRARATVLPRRRRAPGSAPTDDERPRFRRLRVIGEGGMGQVELARDNDIRRTVAVKRLREEVRSDEAMLRFADEVRIVGQLEHPAIVPVYDVGRDESGDVYLVMKHLEGETMEQVVEKLRAGDVDAITKYSIEHRVRLFVAILDAIRYAHARGVILTDLKPANIMIGPYGEVTVLDWGIAKPIGQGTSNPDAVKPLERTLVDSHDKRLQETQFGSLAGTPLYMSPEQAAGRNDELDARSDVYSLTVVLLEWLSLKHPLSEKQTVTEVLAATISGVDVDKVCGEAMLAGVPAELVRCVMKGMVRDRAARYQSVDELESELRRVLDGRVRIQCHVTLSKRLLHETAHWIDRHPMLYTLLFGATILGIVSALSFAVYSLVRAAF